MQAIRGVIFFVVGEEEGYKAMNSEIRFSEDLKIWKFENLKMINLKI